MERQFDQELSELKEQLLKMAGQAEQNVAQALKALVERDGELAVRVEDADVVLDQLEIEIDSKCIQLLALRQPTAKDLRFITMAMKIATDLERIGDQATNISRRALELNKEPRLKPLVDIPRMGQIVQGMIRDVLDAFVYNKPDAARLVIQRDAEVDELNRQLQRELTSFMVEDPHTITRALNLMRIASCLERVGDHATNVGEEIVFLCEARDIRHQAELAR